MSYRKSSDFPWEAMPGRSHDGSTSWASVTGFFSDPMGVLVFEIVYLMNAIAIIKHIAYIYINIYIIDVY